MNTRVIVWSAICAGVFAIAMLAISAGLNRTGIDDGEQVSPSATSSVSMPRGGTAASVEASLPYASFGGGDASSDTTGHPALEVTGLVDYDGDEVFSMSEDGSGDEAVWRYVLTNVGDCRLFDVGLVDALHATGGYDTVLDPGQALTYEITLPVTGDLENRCQVNARTADGMWIEPVWCTTYVHRID